MPGTWFTAGAKKALLTFPPMSVVRLTHFTDPHLYGGEQEALRGVPTLPALKAALAHAQRRDWPPDALLVTGDLVQDDPAGYPHFRQVFGGLGRAGAVPARQPRRAACDEA